MAESVSKAQLICVLSSISVFTEHMVCGPAELPSLDSAVDSHTSLVGFSHIYFWVLEGYMAVTMMSVIVSRAAPDDDCLSLPHQMCRC